MYSNLRTNLPKPTMEMRGFPLPDGIPSFPPWHIFYEYLQSYAKHFELEKYIKFLHNAVSVRREDDVWKVKYQNVKTGQQFNEEFDYVIVANGHFSKPNMPNILGEDIFQGTIIHSHDYKTPEPYRGRRVLVIGAGPSGMDIGMDVTHVCSTMFHSHHSPVNFRTQFPPHYVKKPDVKMFNETGVIFVDGTFEEIDDVIYCTGFHYDFPFLDETCELNLKPHSVSPLYKYMVNIHQPSMIMIGLVVRACLVVALDAQARYATALIKGNFTLPPHDVMMQEWQRRADVLQSKGLPMSHIHFLGEKEDEYYAGLSEESGIDRVPPVMFKIRTTDTDAKLENLYTFRDYVYTVIDDHTFVRTIEDPPYSDNRSVYP
ncbi:hypothetical protein O3G_MSEX007636 [Manduca sexta]|uniref:Flavin-containing monooxygenase n=1 Tax=Manduca sexta TaxID=7130 RepID=A0A921Z6Q9_MANSE|nr:hypothetical protein O3G_MSEX007636 [Manduca sexta]